MGVLVLAERGDGNVPDATMLIPDDLPLNLKLEQQGTNVAIVPGEDFHLKAPRTLLEAALAVGVTPQASVKQPGKRLAFAKVFVREKAGFDVARARHLSHSCQGEWLTNIHRFARHTRACICEIRDGLHGAHGMGHGMVELPLPAW